ncbi:MAG TPA: hypothetical protein VF796_17380 [Humisphaera sp.]
MPVPRAIVDVLNSLLEAEHESLFRFMREGSPYLGRASVEVRKAVDYVAAADFRRGGELYEAIERLGGDPRPPAPQPADQFLAYLSLRFLLPKLIEDKALLMQRYRNAIAAVGKLPAGDGAVVSTTELLKRHLSEHAGETVILQQAADEVAKG